MHRAAIIIRALTAGLCVRDEPAAGPLLEGPRTTHRWLRVATAGLTTLLLSSSAAAQIDQQLAAQYFTEAAALCERDGGRLWGISLCGPIVIGDPATKTIATNQPPPDTNVPASVGFVNAALDWGGTRWATLSWPHIPADERRRGRVMAHELFHRIQPQLGLLLPDIENSHLDTPVGRYWLQLEWRALARALESAGAARAAAVADALAFRGTRRAAFAAAAESERVLEITEGLAQYTGTVVAAGSVREAARDAIQQLAEAEREPTFVRTFQYATGAAYGLLLDGSAPGWTRRIRSADDLATLVAAAYAVEPSADAQTAARAYGGPALERAESAREEERKARLADLVRRFVDGPVVIFPRSRNTSYNSSTMTPIPGEGTMYPSFRSTADWGTLEATEALIASDGSSIRVPAPMKVDGGSLIGEGWRVQLAPGWIVKPGKRAGDFTVEREKQD